MTPGLVTLRGVIDGATGTVVLSKPPPNGVVVTMLYDSESSPDVPVTIQQGRAVDEAWELFVRECLP